MKLCPACNGFGFSQALPGMREMAQDGALLGLLWPYSSLKMMPQFSCLFPANEQKTSSSFGLLLFVADERVTVEQVSSFTSLSLSTVLFVRELVC